MINLRPIQQADNPHLAHIIRSTLEEFGANHPGTVYFEDTTDRLYELFQTPRSFYCVAEQDGAVLGGAGIYPTCGLPDDTAELVKMYLVPQARGKGLGKRLILTCMQKARDGGYRRLYLESMPELARAVSLYERLGFKRLSGPMGDTGHFGCGVWMMGEL